MRRAYGFTLVEMVIAVIILGILAAVASPVAMKSLNAYNAMQDDLVTLDRVRYATERLAREVREVAWSGSAYSFTTFTNAPVFTKSDGVTVTITSTAPNVTLNYSTPVVSAAPTLTNQLSALTFTYYDQSGTVLTTPTTGTVRYVQISLTLTQGSQTYTERTRVQLRNQ